MMIYVAPPSLALFKVRRLIVGVCWNAFVINRFCFRFVVKSLANLDTTSHHNGSCLVDLTTLCLKTD